MPNTPSQAKNVAKPTAIAITVALAATAGYFYYQPFNVENKAPAVVAIKPVIAEPAQPPTPAVAPAISINDIFDDTDEIAANSTDSATAAPEPLPPLDNSDAVIQSQLAELLPSDDALSLNSELVRKLVLAVDTLSRGEISNKYPAANFSVSSFGKAVDSSKTKQDPPRYTMGEATFSRYDQAVALFAAIDKSALAKLYRWSQPLFQQAYSELGQAEQSFNKVAIGAIDQLLSAPDIEGDIALLRPSVMFKYADPELEQRSDSDKLMLRLGADNRRVFKAALRDFKQELKKN